MSPENGKVREDVGEQALPWTAGGVWAGTITPENNPTLACKVEPLQSLCSINSVLDTWLRGAHAHTRPITQASVVTAAKPGKWFMCLPMRQWRNGLWLGHSTEYFIAVKSNALFVTARMDPGICVKEARQRTHNITFSQANRRTELNDTEQNKCWGIFKYAQKNLHFKKRKGMVHATFRVVISSGGAWRTG